MERYLGLDVHAASCTLAVISEKGRKLRDFPVETNGQALVEAIRMIPGHKHLVFEEGLQSAWLYETLSPHVDETVVAGVTESRGSKSEPPRDCRRLHSLRGWGHVTKNQVFPRSPRTSGSDGDRARRRLRLPVGGDPLDCREARLIVESWRQEYNEERPHGALNQITPAAYAAGLEQVKRGAA